MKEKIALRAVWLQVLEAFRHVLPLIRKHDVNLEDQLRRAATSVLLNITEGSGSGKRLPWSPPWSPALASLLQLARLCSRVSCVSSFCACARVLDYVAGVDPLITEKLNEVIGALVKVAR